MKCWQKKALNIIRFENKSIMWYFALFPYLITIFTIKIVGYIILNGPLRIWRLVNVHLTLLSRYDVVLTLIQYWKVVMWLLVMVPIPVHHANTYQCKRKYEGNSNHRNMIIRKVKKTAFKWKIYMNNFDEKN